MAYAQWIYMIIQNMMASGNLTIKEAGTSWYETHLPFDSYTSQASQQPS
jgi:hypothetical protein